MDELTLANAQSHPRLTLQSCILSVLCAGRRCRCWISRVQPGRHFKWTQVPVLQQACGQRFLLPAQGTHEDSMPAVLQRKGGCRFLRWDAIQAFQQISIKAPWLCADAVPTHHKLRTAACKLHRSTTTMPGAHRAGMSWSRRDHSVAVKGHMTAYLPGACTSKGRRPRVSLSPSRSQDYSAWVTPRPPVSPRGACGPPSSSSLAPALIHVSRSTSLARRL